MSASPLLRRYGVTAPTARESLHEAFGNGDTLLIAVDGSTVRGLAWVIATNALDRSAYLRLLLVAPGQRSRGVGAALLSDAELRASTAGSRHMILLVATTNRRARAFYVSRGYRYIGALPGFARPRISEALYVKSMPTEPTVSSRISSRSR